MNEEQVINLFKKGHSIDYIIGYLVVEWNRETKQFDEFTHQWLIKKPNYTRQEITKFVYNTLLQWQKGHYYEIKNK